MHDQPLASASPLPVRALTDARLAGALAAAVAAVVAFAAAPSAAANRLPHIGQAASWAASGQVTVVCGAGWVLLLQSRVRGVSCDGQGDTTRDAPSAALTATAITRPPHLFDVAPAARRNLYGLEAVWLPDARAPPGSVT